MRPKGTNKIIEDHGDWLLVDISTPKHPDATMAVDTDVFEAHDGGRIYALKSKSVKYIYAFYNRSVLDDGRRKQKHIQFHRDVIDVGEGMEVDHIKHGAMSFIDNRRSNLREATCSQNCMNTSMKKNNTSGIKGVCWDKSTGKWTSKIMKDGKRIFLGCFDNIDFAIGARQQAEREMFGEFAYEEV